MKQFSAFITALLFAHCVWGAGTYHSVNLNYQDTTRNFVVYLPNGYVAGTPRPVVFALHGSTSNGAQQIFYSKMDETADSNGFILVAPNGLGSVWNSGFTGAYHGTFPDDVGFISKIIDTLPQLYSVDLTRVYASGMSNGGFQSYRLACELDNRIAAIASVTGSMTDSMAFYCSPTRKVPVLEIHGTADPLVPYDGEPGVWPIENVITFWIGKNQCSNVHDTLFLPDVNTHDSSTVQEIRYLTCSGGAEVLFYKIPGGGHSWPRAPLDYIYGPTNKDFDASQHIWDFFTRYTINGPVGIDEVKKGNVKMYPNPANDFLKIESDENIESLCIYNLLGEIVLSAKGISNSAALNISSLLSGMYLMKIDRTDFSATKRIVKN